jgi:hypothetical protein
MELLILIGQYMVFTSFLLVNLRPCGLISVNSIFRVNSHFPDTLISFGPSVLVAVISVLCSIVGLLLGVVVALVLVRSRLLKIDPACAIGAGIFFTVMLSAIAVYAYNVAGRPDLGWFLQKNRIKFKFKKIIKVKN